MIEPRYRAVFSRKNPYKGGILAIGVAAVFSAPAFAQSTERAIFVSNNGNLEGSVTAYRVDDDGLLTFVNRVITGSRPNLMTPCAGCNAYEISITPDGRHLATSHPAGDLDGITIFSIASDATITQILQVPLSGVAGAPLDCLWIDDEYLAVTRLDVNPDQIAVYRFDPEGPSLIFIGTTNVGSSLGYLARHPSGDVLYSNNSGTPRAVYAHQVDGAGGLTQIDQELSGTPFPLELAVSPNGQWLYAAGGISNDGRSVVGMNIEPDGTLTLMSGSPFMSPGQSPSNVYVSGDNRILVAGHGTDATVRTFLIDPMTGALTATSFMFDVGLQGTLGDVHCLGDLLFVTDNSTAIDGIQGVYSFKLGADGSLAQNAPIYSTQGIAPRSIASWNPPPAFIPGDTNCDGVVTPSDIAGFVLALTDPDEYAAQFPDCNIATADINQDGIVTPGDIAGFVALLTGG